MSDRLDAKATRAAETRWKDRTVIDAILGIDVSKNTLDVSISRCTKVRTKSFANSSDGWHHFLDWLTTQKIQRVHASLESTAGSDDCGHLFRLKPDSVPIDRGQRSDDRGQRFPSTVFIGS